MGDGTLGGYSLSFRPENAQSKGGSVNRGMICELAQDINDESGENSMASNPLCNDLGYLEGKE
ncbi:hypothetical protein FRX31_011844 [Thalictrum thalictroides]|uniref:Uncharacterized protein n=1 Tax=Thalictrum thalictroides TaxID=46969 RepID=A0A7J6WPR0_THATH|nr:hypothetical protein FRX31_011844 [Thalictrum thalictroides]